MKNINFERIFILKWFVLLQIREDGDAGKVREDLETPLE